MDKKAYFTYTWQLQSNKNMQGNYKSDNIEELTKRIIITFSDLIYKDATAKISDYIEDGNHYCNIYVKYKSGDLKELTFYNLPWANGQIDAFKLLKTLYFKED